VDPAKTSADISAYGLTSAQAANLLRRLFDAAVASALPAHCVPPALPAPPKGRTIVIGAGKAAAAMARAAEQHWTGPIEGTVLIRYGHGVACDRIEVREAGHPVPDMAGVAATADMLRHLDDLTSNDLVLCLLSGGASSLLVAPPPGVALEDLQALSRSMLNSGATIAQMNCVRKHVSTVAGGRLIRHVGPARLVTLAISDVPNDDPAVIASGPTLPDPTSRQDAIAVLQKTGIHPSPAIRAWLESEESETPKPGSCGEVDFRLIANPQMALEAAADAAAVAGYSTLILGSALEGEAREVAVVHAGIARQVRRYGQPVTAPCILLSGGETSVTVRGGGRGGRNCEFLLSLTHELAGEPGIHALAADTDGIDGTEDNAGATMAPDTLSCAEAAGISCSHALAASDSYGFFRSAGTLVVTGPTLTNVNDFRAILIERAVLDKETSA